MNNDLISRSELKREFAKFDRIYIADTGNELVNAFAVDKLIDNAPTVPNEYMRGYEAAEREYKRPQGEWIGNAFDEHHCNRCGHPALWEEEPDDYYEVQSNFCPNCGAKMKGEEE